MAPTDVWVFEGFDPTGAFLLILSLAVALVAVALYIGIETLRRSRLWCAVRGHRLIDDRLWLARECRCRARRVTWTRVVSVRPPSDWDEPPTYSYDDGRKWTVTVSGRPPFRHTD